LVGLSGSGKSTILNLIEKFYSPSLGTISLAGADVASFDYESYRSLFTYLPQNAPGFSGSLRDMLNYCAKEPYPDERLIAVLEQVGLYADLKDLGGLDCPVGPLAEHLSGGQRQKIGVARLILSQSEYILLDEATSALDATSSEVVQKCLDQSCAGRTEITVAHNLKTVRNADKILVFQAGKLVGEGKHEALLKSCPIYQSLVREEH
jgi:ABC-type multidrug transport system fused ATPase/permease subunit